MNEMHERAAGVPKRSKIARVAAMMLLITAASTSHAEIWSAAYGIELVEPLATWQGGIVRVKLDAPIVTTQCGTTQVVDFVFTQGTQETRAAVISALYMAFAADKKIQLYVVENACSAPGAPMFTGLNVLR